MSGLSVNKRIYTILTNDKPPIESAETPTESAETTNEEENIEAQSDDEETSTESGETPSTESASTPSESEKTLMELCPTIYPLIADEKVKFPFLLYTRSQVTPIDAKDYIVGDKVRISFAIVNDKYSLTIDIAERVRKLFEMRRDGFFADCKLVSASEGYENDAFVQNLEFEAIILNNLD